MKKDIVHSTILITTFIIFTIGIYQLYVTIPNIPNECEIPRMYAPEYVTFSMSEPNERFKNINSKYTLYRHIQPNYVTKNKALKVRGIPVLYVHGNKGHYKEVRSLGYASDLVADEIEPKKRLEYFTIDFQEEASAVNGDYLEDQAEYINMAASAIIRLYRKQARGDKEKLKKVARSIIVIGHSMGGIAATHALTLTSYRQGSISTIITLSSPHARAPIYLDSTLNRIYSDTYHMWSIGSRYIAHNYYLDRQVRNEKERKAAEEEEKKKELLKENTEDEDIEDEFEVAEEATQTKEVEEGDVGKKKETKVIDEVKESEALKKTTSSSWFSLSNLPVIGYYFQSPNKNATQSNMDHERKAILSKASMFTKKSAHKLRKVVLISLSGGLKDNMVDPSSMSIAHMSTPDKSLGILTQEIPSVSMHIDHNCMVWCKQLVLTINEALYEAVDKKTGFVYKKVVDRMSVFRKHLMSTEVGTKAEFASNLTVSGANRSVPFFHDRIYSLYNEKDEVFPSKNDDLFIYFGQLVHRYGKLTLSMSIGIMMLSFGYQLHIYLPHNGKSFPSLQEALEPEKHLLWMIFGLLHTDEQKKYGITDIEVVKSIRIFLYFTFAIWIVYSICEIPAYQIYFQQTIPEMVYWIVSIIGGTLKPFLFCVTSLLPVDRHFPPFFVFGFIYYAALSLLQLVLQICLLMQRATSFLPRSFPSNIFEVVHSCNRGNHQSAIFRFIHFVTLSIICFAIGHLRFEDINREESLFTLREGGITSGRLIGAAIVMFQIGTYLSTLRFLFLKTVDNGGNLDLDRFRISIGILLFLMIPFQLSIFLKASNAILGRNLGYSKAIFDLTTSFVHALGLYLLSESATTIPVRGAKQLKSGNRMYYGIEIGASGPTPQQSEDIRNAVWKDNLYKELQKYVNDLENDYLEMVDLVKQVNEAQNAKLPGTYDKASAKKATHLYRLCGTLTEQKIMKKLLKLDLVETKGNQDIRAVRKAIIRRINRYLQVGDELKRCSKAMDTIHEEFGAIQKYKKSNNTEDADIVVENDGESIDLSVNYDGKYSELIKKWEQNANTMVEAPQKSDITEDVLLNNLPIFKDPLAMPKKNKNTNENTLPKDGLFYAVNDYDLNARMLTYIMGLLSGAYMCIWALTKMYHATYFLCALAGLLFLRDLGF